MLCLSTCIDKPTLKLIKFTIEIFQKYRNTVKINELSERFTQNMKKYSIKNIELPFFKIKLSCLSTKDKICVCGSVSYLLVSYSLNVLRS